MKAKCKLAICSREFEIDTTRPGRVREYCCDEHRQLDWWFHKYRELAEQAEERVA